MNITSRALNLLGISLREEQQGPSPKVLPPSRTVPRVDVAGALALDSVYRSVSILQTAAKQLTMDAYKASGQAARTPQILREPSEGITLSQFIADTVASLALRGNAYWKIQRFEGNATSVQVLDPLECSPHIDRDSMRRTVKWRGKEYAPADLAHLRLMSIPGKAEGLGPIQSAARTLAGIRDMADYASNWVNTSAIPPGILKTQQNITSQQAEEAKERWNENVSHSSGVTVLGNGLDFTYFALKPSEVQFLESRAFDITTVGRLFGIPPHLLLASIEGTSMTYQNVNDAATDFIRWTLMSYLREIEEAMSQLLGGKKVARFNLDAVLRASTKERMETHKTAIESGVYSPAYARKIEGISDEEPKPAEAE